MLQQFIVDYLDIVFLFVLVRMVLDKVTLKDIVIWLIVALPLQIISYLFSDLVPILYTAMESYFRTLRRESSQQARFDLSIAFLLIPTYLIIDNTLSVVLWLFHASELMNGIAEIVVFVILASLILKYNVIIKKLFVRARMVLPSVSSLLVITSVFFGSSLAIYLYSEYTWVSLTTVLAYTFAYYLLWLIVFICLVILFKEYYDNLNIHLLKQKYEDTINLNQAVSQQYEQVRHRQHDIKNLLIDLQGQIKANQSDTALKMIQDQLEATPEITLMPEVEANLNKITSSGIQNVIRRHLYEILAVGASVNIEVSAIINFRLEDEIKLARIIGILLDNARDALKGQENGVFQLSLSRFDAETVVLAVRNSIDQSVDVNQMIKNKFSTKDNHHGYGLTNIREIVNGDDHFNLEIETSEHFVTVELYMRGAR